MNLRMASVGASNNAFQLLHLSYFTMTGDEFGKTVVVNVMKDDYDVYIGRYNKWKGLEGSMFRNREWMKNNSMEERMRSIEVYRVWFYEEIKKEWFRKEVEKLRGKVLGCWCKPLPCHGDVIVEYLEK